MQGEVDLSRDFCELTRFSEATQESFVVVNVAVKFLDQLVHPDIAFKDDLLDLFLICVCIVLLNQFHKACHIITCKPLSCIITNPINHSLYLFPQLKFAPEFPNQFEMVLMKCFELFNQNQQLFFLLLHIFELAFGNSLIFEFFNRLLNECPQSKVVVFMYCEAFLTAAEGGQKAATGAAEQFGRAVGEGTDWNFALNHDQIQ